MSPCLEKQETMNFRTAPADPPPPATEVFRRDVLRGLARPQKELPCKYFYDAEGSRLFEEICELPEYYLTRCELAVLERHAGTMAGHLGPRCALIEYGSGSGRKTRLLLDRLQDPAAYVPVDINRDFLFRSAEALAASYPGLEVVPVCADFTRPFQLPTLRRNAARRAVYFSGSTIGNFGPPEAVGLLRNIARLVGPGGSLLIGVDLKKDPRILEPAYDDSRGVTAAFNLNLLARINRELGSDFRLDRFRHRALYDAEHDRIEMQLVSRGEQSVRIGNEVFAFAEGEVIRTEYSYKYGLEEFAELAVRAGLRRDEVWTDDRGLYSVQFFEAGA
jgi:dimethylhistidine N-methyltransferase